MYVILFFFFSGQHMEKVVQQNHLEAQLAKAKYAKINLLLKQETEKFLREKQSLLENMSELQMKCTLLTSNELKLRTELGDYTSKYEEFQTVLNRSSQVFASFKTDMEAVSIKIYVKESMLCIYIYIFLLLLFMYLIFLLCIYIITY